MNMLSPHRTRVLPVAACIVALCLSSGCKIDNLLNPSETGRFENTPVVLPILEKLDIIDEPDQEIAGLSAPTPEDLRAEVQEYILGPGDTVLVTVLDLLRQGADTSLQRRIDEVGYIHLPVIEHIKASGLSTDQLRDRIIDFLDPDFLEDPIVTVVLVEGQQRQFNIFGVRNAGPWKITKNNFRLMDAVAIGGGVSPNTDTIYVIRQIALSEDVNQGTSPGPRRQEGPPSLGGQPTPKMMRDPAKVLEDLTEGVEPGTTPKPDAPAPLDPPAAPGNPGATLESALTPESSDEGRFIYIDGKWVLVKDPIAAGIEETARSQMNQMVTQRVIEVDAKALMRGEAIWNVAIRPNDVVRVVEKVPSIVTISGNVNRPGTYDLPGEKTLTLTELVAAAGDLSELGVPERVDLWRRIGDNEYAIVLLNLRAIEEGVQPDIFLKPHDRIKVGTNLWASFVAVIRNGFRMSYGFGFLLDRNFGNDVFGPPPVERFRR